MFPENKHTINPYNVSLKSCVNSLKNVIIN